MVEADTGILVLSHRKRWFSPAQNKVKMAVGESSEATQGSPVRSISSPDHLRTNSYKIWSWCGVDKALNSVEMAGGLRGGISVKMAIIGEGVFGVRE